MGYKLRRWVLAEYFHEGNGVYRYRCVMKKSREVIDLVDQRSRRLQSGLDMDFPWFPNDVRVPPTRLMYITQLRRGHGKPAPKKIYEIDWREPYA